MSSAMASMILSVFMALQQSEFRQVLGVHQTHRFVAAVDHDEVVGVAFIEHPHDLRGLFERGVQSVTNRFQTGEFDIEDRPRPLQMIHFGEAGSLPGLKQ